MKYDRKPYKIDIPIISEKGFYMEHTLITLIFISILQLTYLVGIFIAVGLVLGLIERRSNHYVRKTFGYKGILATAWIGTPIHELGHAVMCIIFRHKIVEVKWLQLNDPNGVLGYVSHTYNKRSIYQRAGNFFIGLAPVFSGILALIGSMYLLVPSSYRVVEQYVSFHVQTGGIDQDAVNTMFLSSIELLKSLFSYENVINPAFWLFVVLAVSISSHIALSTADIKGSAHGLFILFALLIISNVVAEYVGLDTGAVVNVMSQYNVYFLAFSSVALVFSVLTLAISYFLYLWKGRTT